ncbi:MAG: sigma-70 family RNA polymerase sigma factor [Bacteroidota bacterium]
MKPAPKNVCEESTFRGLFKDLGLGLRNFLYYKTGDAQQAEDLAQEAFLKLWKACARVAPAKAKSFLFTVANNLFLDQVKHQKVVLHFQKQAKVTSSTIESPEYLYEKDEFQQRLEKAIANLPEKNRIVFLMNRIDKLTYQEIADRLGISKKAVEKRMSKALVELRVLNQKI